MTRKAQLPKDAVLCRWRDEGVSHRDIADRCGVSKSVISRRFREIDRQQFNADTTLPQTKVVSTKKK